jgi:hypothetical protein
MSMHLFSTPVECTHCGSVVDDPTVDRCPGCNRLLRERRTPSRLAGVERRYGNVRFLLGALRFVGVITVLVALLVFFFATGDDGVTLGSRVAILMGSLLIGMAFFTIAAFFEVALDIEENTRASFRVQQMLLDHVEGSTQPAPPADAPTGTGSAP